MEHTYALTLQQTPCILIDLIHRHLGQDFLHEYNTAAGLHLIFKITKQQ